MCIYIYIYIGITNIQYQSMLSCRCDQTCTNLAVLCLYVGVFIF